MRLLQRSDIGELSLYSFDDEKQIPPYAILSHTWGGDKEEITFEDLTNSIGKEKTGYEKIRFCGEQARKDDLQYFWVDTCCINKENPAELSLAINSMFRWYYKATRCYVYLSDVSTRKRKGDVELRDNWELDFQRSRWFTRGWTLQELLAPASVEFFSREHERVGDKDSLRQQIHDITGIPKLALQGARLSQFSDKERFSWIERRETGVAEDRAYSLLGIFDVRIPLRYGEGMSTAFKRLEEEIDKLNICIRDLRLTDPRDDKKRIEDTKGGLLEGSYHWIIEDSNFQHWREAQQSRLLWIKGDPGKGKTMLLCGIANELTKSMAKADIVAYFFCQATDSSVNNAIAVLRGLLYLLVNQQPLLISHIQKKYKDAGKSIFQDLNAWFALSEIFTSILQDPSLDNTYLIIDALDECRAEDLPKLLDFIVQKSSISPRVKWLVSSRNWPNIEEGLERLEQKVRLCLELNTASISIAVGTYVQHKVSQLAQQKKYNKRTRDAVQDYLLSNANDTFLWVALVCQRLGEMYGWETLAQLNAFPAGLDSLYQRMMDQIVGSAYADLCKRILATIAIIYRPVTLKELTSLVEIPKEMPEDMLEEIVDDLESLEVIIGLCGSFLTIREEVIYFVHQSAKDYLYAYAHDKNFPDGEEGAHYNVFSRSLRAMSTTLQRDMYGLLLPGTSIKSVQAPRTDPLAPLGYSCVFWASHYNKAYQSDLTDGGKIHQFLQKYFLYWLEALSLIGKVSEGALTITSLESYIRADKSPNLHTFVHDAWRFTLYNRSAIETTPLQLYYSALIFAPEKSIVRKQFEKCIPISIERKPKEESWSRTLQTLEGHSSGVRSVAFSPDGKTLASGSYDYTVRLWDAVTGAEQQTLKGHSSGVLSVAFSPDGKTLASGSYDYTVRLWDAVTGAEQQTLKGHSSGVWSVAFSPDGKTLASGSDDNTVRLWDAITGAEQQTLKGHSSAVWSVAFSPDGKTLVSGSYDHTVRLWDAVTGAEQQTLKGHSSGVWSVAFSPDGKTLASGSYDYTVRLWDAVTGAEQQTLKGHSSRVWSVAFSPDGKTLASGSYDYTVRLWDAVTGAEQQTLKGHSSGVWSVAFSPDGKTLASGSYDNTVRLWDAVTGAEQQTLKGHSSTVLSVTFWDDVAGAAPQSLQGTSSPQATVNVKGDWVTLDGQETLWLPPDYRPSSVAIYNRVIVIACPSGRIFFLQF